MYVHLGGQFESLLYGCELLWNVDGYKFYLSEKCKVFFSKINKKYKIENMQMDSLVNKVRKDYNKWYIYTYWEIFIPVARNNVFAITTGKIVSEVIAN